MFDLCKKCCVKRFREENAAFHSMAGSDHSYTITQCPVHKKKSKHCEKNSHSNESVPNLPLPSPTLTSSFIRSEQTPKIPYQCECKVLLVGIGADEQLAGYSRHRTVYQRGGIAALVEELNMDTARIYNRNLGR